jgi:UDP-N-acetylglucosamine 4,6-dehydratase
MEPKRIVITGGTGSLGQGLVRKLLSLDTTDTITVLSRDELKQYEMQRQLKDDPRVEFALGDVRNASRLSEVFASHDCVIHTAALKQVVMGEHNPMEYIMTNILGTANVVEAAISQGVERAIVISTDKAASPVNLYGGTKFVADKYVTRTATDSRKVRESGLKLSVVRFGNFLNSRGSVLPIWREMHAAGLPIPVTEPAMTRFWLTLDEAVAFLLKVLDVMKGGEIFVPHCRAMSLANLVETIAPGAETERLGSRVGEKLHEELISELEVKTTRDMGDYYAIYEDESAEASTTANNGASILAPIVSNSVEFQVSIEDMREIVRTV